ncbi:hypothetical protein B7486_07795 [cyanobacterium TDX16]|nr:hypothetical protein B7486_07795 [cyanobacterium TDX16]
MLIIIATTYFPNLNPIGAPSLIAAGIGCMVILCGWRSRRSNSYAWTLAFSPFWLLLGSAFITGSFLGRLLGIMPARCFPDADDYAAQIVFISVAFGSSLGLLRVPSKACWIVGGVFGLASGWVITLYAFVLTGLSSYSRWNSPLWTGLASFTAVWIPLAALMISRTRKLATRNTNGCESCGYNLTGNISGWCPECGAPCKILGGTHESTKTREPAA